MTASKPKIIFIIGLVGHVAGWHNVALHNNGSTCKASGAFSGHHCHQAIDGLLWYNRDWAVPSGGEGIWIQIIFPREYILTYARIMQRFNQVEQNRRINLTFDGGISVEEYLMKRQGNSWNSYRGQHWDEFSLDHIRTSSARIDVIDVYTTYHNGFNEIEFYTGINPCRLYYTFLRGSCYRYSAYEHVAWSDARKLCQHEDGDLANIGSETEMGTVLQWLEKAFHFDSDFWLSNSNLTFSDQTVDMGQVGSVSIHKPGGTLGYSGNDSFLLYICEAEPTFTEWRYVAPTKETVPDVDDGGPVAQPATKREKNYTAMIGMLSFCVIVIAALVAIIAFGGYRFYKINRKFRLSRSDSDTTISSRM